MIPSSAEGAVLNEADLVMPHNSWDTLKGSQSKSRQHSTLSAFALLLGPV